MDVCSGKNKKHYALSYVMCKYCKSQQRYIRLTGLQYEPLVCPCLIYLSQLENLQYVLFTVPNTDNQITATQGHKLTCTMHLPAATDEGLVFHQTQH